MKGYWQGLICALTLALASGAGAQSGPAHRTTKEGAQSAGTPSPHSTAGPYSQEPYVIETYISSMRFEDDGTSTRSIIARIRIQSAVAAEKFSELNFAYDSSAAELEFRMVRLLKPDGTSLNAPLNSIQEGAAPALRDAPAYASYRQKSLAIPDVRAGDTLEYEILTRVTRPQARGEFWMQHSFLADAIVLREELVIDVPASRKMILESPRFPYATEKSPVGNRTIYRWRHANLAMSSANEDPKVAEGQARMKPADVQMTTFGSWSDVAKWYAKLEQRDAPLAPEIRAKADEITSGRATDWEKIQAVYEYVSKEIRTIDLPFGASGYAPRPAAQVLADGYGTEADQHILLASLLDAVGCRAAVALIPATKALNESVPSPAQFGHVITVVMAGDGRIWLDPTSGVAPFEFLPPSLRNKPVLLISSNGTGQIVHTPADPPFASTQQVNMEGRVSDLGKLSARIHYQLRGDNEFVLRLAFRRTPQPQWKELAQTILALDGLHGEIVSVKPGDPTETEKPFELNIEYSQAGFLDWASRQARLPMALLTIGVPDASKDESSKNIELGSPLLVTTRLKLTLPERVTARAPVAIAVSRDYAEFKSSYHFDDHTLSAERSLDFKMRAIPGSRLDDYLAFSHAVAADQAQSLLVENSASSPPEIPRDATPAELFDAGAAALAAGRVGSSAALFERLVEIDPGYKDGWNELGLAYMRSGNFDRAAFAFGKQLESSPSDAQVHNYLGLVFQQQHNYEEAARAFRKQTEVNPLDTVAHAALGAIYLSQHDYAEAAPEFDKAVVLAPDKAELQVSLGQAYAGLGQNDKALAAFDRAVALSPTPLVWNGVASSLADQKLDLAKAQKYSEAAVAGAAARLQDIDIAHAGNEQFSEESKLANYWDTLGWVNFQEGRADLARRYIQAAWLLQQKGQIASHLGRMEEKAGKKDEAIQWYALALAAPDPDEEARARLTLLLGGNSRIDSLVEQRRPLLKIEREVAAGKVHDAEAKADFLVVLAPASGKPDESRIKSIRFVSGNDELRDAGEALKRATFGPMFPAGSPAQLVRGVTLTCSSTAPACSVVLLPLEVPQPASAQPAR